MDIIIGLALHWGWAVVLLALVLVGIHLTD
jgi:hypothetical protein